jgi:hypothetical protein
MNEATPKSLFATAIKQALELAQRSKAPEAEKVKEHLQAAYIWMEEADKRNATFGDFYERLLEETRPGGN